MWGDSEKPDPLLLGNHHHRHHPHPHPHHFGLAAKPFYHHHPHHHLGAGTAASAFSAAAAQLPATSSSTPTASAHPHHSHQPSTSTTVGGSLNALRTRSTTQPAIVMWKGETSRKKRFEPFCSPMVPHVPIRERLARRGTSADMMSDDASAYTLYAPRRRRMSLLQSLRQQNRALADSGLDMPQQQQQQSRARTDSESTHAASSPPPVAAKPVVVAAVAKTNTKKSGSFSSQIKNKIFGKKSSSSKTEVERKSPSTTADSGRGSQGHLEDKLEALTLSSGRHHHEELDLEEEEEEELEELEYDDDDDEDDEEDDEDDDEENDAPILSKKRAHLKKQRTNSCPDISSRVFNIATTSSKRCPMAGHEIETSDDDDNNTFKCSGRSRLNPKYVQQHHQQIAISSRDDVDYRSSRAASTISRRSAQTEDLADFDDNISSIVLDQFLSSTHLTFGDDSDSEATFSFSGTVEEEEETIPSSSTTTTSHVQTDLTLLNVEREIADYLQHCRESTSGISEEGMNFIAKHFFEYQSFMNIPHKAVHLHKMPASQAGTDPSMGWAPKNMLKAGKHQPAPAARASRVHRDPRPNGTKYGRAGKHEHREWGDRHGELRDEKAVCHKDAWTKFLANDDQGPRTAFECEFEDRVLATEEETLQEKLCHASPDEIQLNALYAAANKSISGATTSSCGCCELLTILTYAPTVQFVTATVKKAKSLPFNNAPFARIMLFEGRRLVEQKQTTVNPSLLHKSSLDGSSAASTSSNDGVTDASFSESFLFHVPPTKLEKSHIVIEIYDHETSGEVKKIGHCVIGRKVDGTGNAHWIQMVRQHGLPVCMWHRIAQN